MRETVSLAIAADSERLTFLVGSLLIVLLLLLWISVRHKPLWSFVFFIAILLGTGLALISLPIPYLGEGFRKSLGDALLVSAVLALTVDWYLKERVLREISTDVSKYLIGYRLPDEVQNRIRWLLQTQWIRRNCQIRCRLRELASKRIQLEVTISEELQNITAETLPYQDTIEYEKHDPQQIMELRCDSDDTRARYCLEGAAIHIREKADDPGVMQALGKRVRIPPAHDTFGRAYRFTTRYQVQYPATYSDVISFGKPTIGAVLEVECPTDYRFNAGEADVAVHNRWEYRRLFLPGESIRFRWEKF